METSYTLYGYRGSGSASVEAALVRLGLPFRTVDAATWDEASALAELRRINPLGQIPTLCFPDGSVMTESAAILVELGLRHPESRLLPAAAGPRAQALRGLVYIAANCYSAIGIIDYPERYCTDADEAVAERIRAGTRARLHAMWEGFADAFPASPFLSGADLGALDLLAAVVSKWSGARKHLAAARPQWFPVLVRIENDPVHAAVFERHWPKEA